MKLHDYRQWLLWRIEYKNDTKTKVPINQHGEPSGVTSYHDFMDWKTCDGCVQRKKIILQGHAFVFLESDPFLGVDIDNCLDKVYRLADWAVPIVDRFKGTYIEYSPSGTGLKIYCIAKKPKGARSCAAVGTGAIEVYDSGRYFAFTTDHRTGSAEDVTEQQEAVDWLLDTYLSAPVVREQFTNSHDWICGSDFERRAAAYLDVVGRPLPGTRNKTCLSAAGHIGAFVDENRKLIDLELVMQIMLEWNASLPEPMAVGEVRRVVHNARNKGTVPAPKPKKEPIEKMKFDGVDISAILRGEEPPKPASPELKLDPELWEVPGFIGEVVKYCHDSCFLRQPAIALAGAIALQAALAGRKVYCEFGNRPHLYTVGVVRTGAGKDRPKEICKEILQKVAEPIGHLESPKSGASIIAALDKYPAKLAIIDEFGQFMRAQKGPQASPFVADIGSNLLKLYSEGKGKWAAASYADSRRDVIIDRPSLSVFGLTVPDNLWTSLQSISLQEGMLTRLLLFRGEDRPQKGPRNPNLPIPESILAHAKAWFERGAGNLAGQACAHEETLITYTDAARERIHSIMDHEGDFDRFKTAEERILASRIAQNTCKLAIAYACSQEVENPVITLDAVEWGYRVADYTRQYTLQGLDLIPENDHHAKMIRVLTWFRDTMKGECTLTDFTRKWKNWAMKDRHMILENLLDSQTITKETVATEARPKIILRLTS